MKTLSLTCLTTKDYAANARAVNYCLDTLANKINITKLYWFSNRPFPEKTSLSVEWQYIPTMSRLTWPCDYNRVTLELLPKVLDTDFNLMLHDDGFPVNAEAWTDEFLDYDYIGARWHWLKHEYNVGNGGFSLRSSALYRALQKLSPNIYQRYDLVENKVLLQKLQGWIGTAVIPEDILIAVFLRSQLESEYQIKFAPADLADRFSIENFWDSECPWLGKSLGFHGRSGIHTYYGVEL